MPAFLGFSTPSATLGLMVVVVIPLTSIIKDQVTVNYYTFWTDAMPQFQVSSLSKKGLRVAFISGEQNDDVVKDGVMKGLFQLVFFTPEVLHLNRQWRNCLSSPL